jgi:tetratricopeptide (TPR) repeat protein
MEEGLKLKRKIPGFKSVTSANALDNLAQAYARTGDLESANKFEQEALSTYQSLHKTETHDYSIALSNHANTLRQLKQYKEAEQFFAKAVATQQKLDKEDSIELAKILLNAGGMYCETNKLDSAKRLLDRASKIIRAKLNKEHPLYRLSIKSERVLYKKRVDSLLTKDPNPVRPEVAQAVLHLAALYDAEGDQAQSAAAYKQGLSIQEQLLPEDSAELKKVRDEYAAVCKKLSN